jgi:glycosyltransferase involved in cell wall biosynthesis
MKIVLFSHPPFLGSQSMPRYATMLLLGMRDRGHLVEIWSPKPRFYKLPFINTIKKWFGYIDQYILFPFEVRLKLITCSKETLFVFADHALGPWVYLVKNRPHVIHCHDFLALHSALSAIPENPTGFKGKIYQNYIRNGFSKGKNFICISQQTQECLKKLHRAEIRSSVVCYNGFNRPFHRLDLLTSRNLLGHKLNIKLTNGYILHIGGNQFYKNRRGVLEIYEAWRSITKTSLPLLMIGSQPTAELIGMRARSEFKNDIYFITDLSDEYINSAYSGASCLLFPSLAEGFGWPIAEAMASGTPVITTDRAPMNEVGGTAAFYINKRPFENLELNKWQVTASAVLNNIISLNSIQREVVIQQSIIQSQKFNTAICLDAIENCYKEIISP